LKAGLDLYGGHLSTGIQTSHRLMLELARQGCADTAWQLLTNRTFPSWIFSLDQGATTIWERWDGFVPGRGFQDRGMNSFNHWALGAVGEWMIREIVGLHPDASQPGYQHFLVRPRPGGGVTWARGHHDSIHGRIACAWKVGKRFELELTVPANTSATVWLPADDPGTIREGRSTLAQARGIQAVEMEPGFVRFRVESGEYHFAVGGRRP
jgi:alpha-L-rhamnosidase